MTPRMLLASALVLCSTAAAQYVTSPSGFTYKEGNSNTTFALGAYAGGRFQYADGQQRGTAMIIKGTAYRPDNYIYGDGQGMGRSWTNVQLLISDCDLSTFGSTFTKNPTSTPTEVFSASVSWPTQSGKPSTFPAPWSMMFPFHTNWSYDGGQDICLDYTFAGGTLVNSDTWTGSTSKYYYMDSQSHPTYKQVSSTSLGAYGNKTGCNDRGTTNVYGAQIWTQVTVYSGDYSNASLRNTIAFVQNGQWFPGSRPALTVLGFRPLRYGFAFPGVTCNKVHIDFALPTYSIPSFFNSNGTLVTLNLSVTNPGIKDLDIVTQVIWGDSQTNQPLLSNAATLLLPGKPRSQPTNLLYYYNPANATGSRSSSRTYQPIRRYTK